MQATFSIWIVSPPGNLHSRCFEEVALSLQHAFQALGYRASVVTEARAIQGRVIVLGAHLALNSVVQIPSGAILYNLEQIEPTIDERIPGYLDLLRRFHVWDYSALNIGQLKQLGIDATLCGVGYMPALTRVMPAREDLDILFIGSVNPRRLAVFQEIEKSGRKVSILYNSGYSGF
jgi:hypothetical protein